MFAPHRAAQGPGRLQLAFSLLVHGLVLGWVAFGSPDSADDSRSAYQRVFAPHEKKLVWYRFDRKLPEVSPAESSGAGDQPRAEMKHPEQTIVAHASDAQPSKQFLWLPAPKLKVQPDLNAPNLLAFETPRAPDPLPKPKEFVSPREAPRPSALQPDFGTAPEIAVSLSSAKLVLPKAPVKPFTAPDVQRPDAPRLTADTAPIVVPPALLAAANLIKNSQPVKEFTPPKEGARPANDVIWDAPIAVAAPDLTWKPTLVASARPAPREFKAPASPTRAAGPTVDANSAPSISTLADARADVASIAGTSRPAARAFTPPQTARPSTTALDGGSAPQVTPTNGATLSAAIVSLDPSTQIRPVLPEASRPAQISVSPDPSKGSGDASSRAPIVIPGLTVRGGAKDASPVLSARAIAPTSRESLSAAMRTMPDSARPLANRRPPAAVFGGRTVYTVAVQSANLTSAAGSTLLWFAAREEVNGQQSVRAPNPLRKVDPAYAASAMEEHVEGVVTLAAVIRKDGHVADVHLIKGCDERLERSAIAALQKWLFEPAQRNGEAIDVDALVEIPFRLSPLVKP